MLYDQYGALALGWVAAFAEAGYIILLHRRNSAIYREFVDFAKDASEKLIPVLSKNTEVMSTVVTQQNEIADCVNEIRQAQGPAIGQLQTVVAYIMRFKDKSRRNDPEG